MQVVLTDRALADLAALRDYLAEENPTAARKQAALVLSRIALLAEHPLLGRPGRVEGTRELVIAGTRYIAAYLIDGEFIRILAIIHGSMMWPKLLP